MNSSNEICCPKCGSNQITANKKGFSGKKAVAGAVLTGGIGLLAGTIGSNKILITCLNCGNQFKPGSAKKTINAVPKMIWDEQSKSHKLNPSYKSDTVSMPLWQAVLIFVIGIAFLICIIKAL
jgi:predicted  nucleic acid-binding Zn-ribbon protein